MLTLAFGIGVNTNIFSMVSAFFLQPLPVKNPKELVLVLQRSAAWKLPQGHSYPDYRNYRERVGGFSDALALMMTLDPLSVAGRPADRTWIEAVSGNYFSMLGTEPSLGRLFLPTEGQKTGADPIIVPAYRHRRRFGHRVIAVTFSLWDQRGRARGVHRRHAAVAGCGWAGVLRAGPPGDESRSRGRAAL